MVFGLAARRLKKKAARGHRSPARWLEKECAAIEAIIPSFVNAR
jgi:hypothetical protein